MTLPKSLEIGLSSWIIQDGNYPDFQIGNEYKFALEISPRSIQRVEADGTFLNHIQESEYTFNGKVLFREPRLTVVDVGVLCYHEGEISKEFEPGDFISGDLYLGVDPFFWFETHAKRRDAPNLIYRWMLNGILLETTEWQESINSSGRRLLSRNEQTKSFKPVGKTDAWNDDNGHAHYILQCNLLGPACYESQSHTLY